jgi:hypothetical protein
MGLDALQGRVVQVIYTHQRGMELMEITVRMSIVRWRSKWKKCCLSRGECIRGYPSLLVLYDYRLL